MLLLFHWQYCKDEKYCLRRQFLTLMTPLHFYSYESFLLPKGFETSVHEGENAQLECSAHAGSTISEGEQVKWEYEQNGSWEKVAIKDGMKAIQETFREKIYNEDKSTGILSNNLTTNEKFKGRVDITSNGTLILFNSTEQDSGNYKCSYRGITGPVEKSLLHLSVKPCIGKMILSFATPVRQVGKRSGMLINQSVIAILKYINQSINQ